MANVSNWLLADAITTAQREQVTHQLLLLDYISRGVLFRRRAETKTISTEYFKQQMASTSSEFEMPVEKVSEIF